MELTQKELKKQLHYNPLTGVFTRIKTSKKNQNGWLDNGYIRIMVNGKTYKAHRLAFLYMTGEIPKDHIDHINHNRSDNRFLNLRIVSNKINQQNQNKRVNNKSGVTGVNWVESRKRWAVSIGVNSKRIHIGRFKDKDDAIAARKSAETKYGFHINHGQ